MGAFYLLSMSASPARDAASMRATSTLRTQGFGAGERIERPDFVLEVAPGLCGTAPSIYRRDSGDFCVIVGTLCYRGAFGCAAAKRLWTEFEGSLPSPALLSGAFCALLLKRDTLHVFGDPFGLLKVYSTRDPCCLTSSFLTATRLANRLRPRPQEIFEYVFSGATYGLETVVEDVALHATWQRTTCRPTSLESHESYALPQPTDTIRSADEHAGQLKAHVLEIFSAVAQSFGERVGMGLSGGFDSRLMLAGMLAVGQAPELHVYGAVDDPDVIIAKQVARVCGLPIEHVDKSERIAPPGELHEIVRRNFLEFDGLPTDGIFDSGVDSTTRRARAANGHLHLNGGGGEILRNFFKLRDRSYSALELLWTFYSMFDPRSARPPFSEAAYHEALQRKLLASLAVPDRQRLTRAEVELAYPYFRCRFWTGRNNSINCRFGEELTPFLDYGLLTVAIDLPISLKTYGTAQARVIELLAPQVAAVQSTYGRSFVDPPAWPQRASMMGECWRPPWLRRMTFRTRNRLQRVRQGAATLPQSLRVATNQGVLARNLPQVSEWLALGAVQDRGQQTRAATLEYFLTHALDYC